jgi:endogenous inhibitor of DNA gyrase (YacG/DUF329 family)
MSKTSKHAAVEECEYCGNPIKGKPVSDDYCSRRCADADKSDGK